MKKFTAVVSIVLALMLCVCACAETIHRQKNIDMESVLSDMIMNVSFETEDITDTDVYATIYDTFNYDIMDISKLSVGDTIETSLGDVVVESIENDDDGILINGGYEEGGVTLATEDDTNGFYEKELEMPAMVAVGQAQLSFADTVTINVYKMDEDLSITGEGYDTTEVPGSEVGAALKEITERFYGSVSPYGTTVRLGAEEAQIVEITIDYVP